MTYPIYWVPSPDYDRGRANPVIAFVNHRIVGTLASADTTFTSSSRLVSSEFAVGYGCGKAGHVAGPHAHQYVYIDDTAWTNGDVRTDSEWAKRYPTQLVNSRTIKIEHHDNGHLPSGDPRKGVVPPDVQAVAKYVWQTLLSGDLARWEAAGIKWRSRSNAERVAAECRAIVPGPHTVVDHHYIAGSNKPSCWRAWASDTVGFPQAAYLAALTEDEMDYEAKFERWLLDGGPGRVTTVGAPIKSDGTVDYTRRLALTSGTGDTNRRLQLIARNRLTEWDASRDTDLYGSLASYALPIHDCTDEIAASVAIVKASARITWEG